MAEKLQISAEEYLALPQPALLDVRAEIEFDDGHLPGSVNIPILNTQERHQVGLCYKEQGQDAAIALGHKLVNKDRLVTQWRAFLALQKMPMLTCFRGGMRSEYSQNWIEESGLHVARIRGGYKALRRELLKEFAKPRGGFVVTGLTGSAKTAFVRGRGIDLEGLASHRGSAFGGLFQERPQPSQQTFENALATELRGKPQIVLEDESRLVGRCVIPPQFFETMRELPRIFLECPLPQRVENIFQEYVRAPLADRKPESVAGEIIVALRTIKNRLGGLATSELEAQIRQAFSSANEEQHRDWIQRLLVDYYDDLYVHAMKRHPHEPVFRGNAEECAEWLQRQRTLTMK